MIERFISTITQNWSQSSDQAGLFEIRCLGENRKTVIQRFAQDELHDAVDFAVRMNEFRLNIYMMINPMDMNASIGAGKGATDTDILRAHYSFADADDAAGLAGLNQLCSQVEPDIVVVTGWCPASGATLIGDCTNRVRIYLHGPLYKKRSPVSSKLTKLLATLRE